jgi:D-alanyl-D-alanine carboxypeptidase/D-alanyl-D-alanine-endopeptidase (penicillin-binding protein 4)
MLGMTKFFLYISALFLIFCDVKGQTSNVAGQKVETWRNSELFANTAISLAVCDARTGEILIKSEPQLSLVPASIFKVVTMATALEVFGPDYRFKTVLAYSGSIKNDTLWGDLLIIGGGDPTLGSDYFPGTKSFTDDWAKSLKTAKIRVVTGKLIVDSSVYEKIQVPGTWAWEDLGSYYGATPSGVSVYDNLFEIHMSSPLAVDQPAKIRSVKPEIPGLEIRSEVLSSDINSDQSYIFGNPEDNRRVIRGTIPKGESDFTVKASMPDPAVVLSFIFRQKLRESGIEILGTTAYERATIGYSVVKETFSPPLSEIIRITNFESVNLFAEHLLKHLAWQKNGIGTTKDGCQFVADFWKEKGMPMNGFFMTDGSGLSRFDALTAGQMCWILNYMNARSSNKELFIKSLPAAGWGTLTAFDPENFPNNCLRAKSGSMTRVRCYAGYLKTDSGKDLSFAIMLNNFSCTMKEATQKIQELLVKFREL